MFSLVSLTFLIASSLVVRADPNPTAPGPGDVFNEGSQCSFTWTPDTTGTWKAMSVELMTGDNFNMVHLTTVTTLDGTDASKTSYSYPCPSVTPNSAIYFYQFSNPSSSSKYWTTRFAIADASGTTVPPAQSTQSNGAAIPWGTGALQNPSDATPPPASGNSSSSAASSSTSTSSGPGSSSSSSTGTSSSGTDTSSSGIDTPSSSNTKGSLPGVSTSAAAASTPSTAAGSNSTSTTGEDTANGAAMVGVEGRMAVVALALTALVFAVGF